MGLSLIVLIGIMGVFFFILFRNPLMGMMGENNSMVNLLKNKKWFQNHWLSGSFLFLMNAVLFFLTGLILYGIMFLTIPFLHLLVMALAVVISIVLWMTMNQAWQGEKRDRIKLAAVGSSFYFLLTILFVYQFATLEPAFEGDDPFMRGIGLMFGMIVTTVAFVTCIIITGFSNRRDGSSGL